MRFAPLVAIFTILIGGCGLKGDLYLPEEPAPGPASAPAGTPSDNTGGSEQADEDEQS